MNPPARDTAGRLLPGQPSLNPLGRAKGPRGVAQMIMKMTDGGSDFVHWALLLWKDVDAPIEWRWRAFEWLTRNVGLGGNITLNQLNVTVNSGRDLKALNDDDLERIDGVFRDAMTRKPIDAEGAEVEP